MLLYFAAYQYWMVMSLHYALNQYVDVEPEMICLLLKEHDLFIFTKMHVSGVKWKIFSKAHTHFMY